MWQNIVEPGRWRWQYGKCTFNAGYQSVQILIQNMQFLLIFHCSKVAWMCLNVTLYIHCVSCCSLATVMLAYINVNHSVTYWPLIFQLKDVQFCFKIWYCSCHCSFLISFYILKCWFFDKVKWIRCRIKREVMWDLILMKTRRWWHDETQQLMMKVETLVPNI